MNIDMVNRLTAEQIANMPEIRIPIALQRPEFRFVKLIMWEKKAFEPGWTRTTNYTHDAEGLKNWLAKGGNYGVSTGIGGLLVVDIDNVGRMEELGILSRMPETYTVRTRSGGLHFYYICNDFDKKRIMYDLVKTESYISNGRKSQGYMHLGEMQWLGQQVVGPSSRYREIGEDSSVRIQSWKEENLTAIREIGAEEIMKVFAGKVRFSRKLDAPATEEDDIENLEKESKTRAGKIRKTQKSSKIEPIKIGWLDKIKIADIALPNPIVKSDPLGTGEIQGGHPLHGSDNGLNFSVNVKKNIWHCFVAGTLVLTPDGMVDIKDIKEGDMVTALNGLPQKVKAKFVNNYAGSIFTINSPVADIEVTEGHPIYVFDSDSNKYKWVNVEDISQRFHSLVCPLNFGPEIEVGEDMATLFGWYLAEGHCSKRNRKNGKSYPNIQWTLSKKEEKEAEEILNSLHNLGYDIKANIYPKRGTTLVNSNSCKIANKIQKICNTGERIKHFGCLIKADKPSLKKIIDCYERGDGHIQGGSQLINGVSKARMIEYQLACARLGKLSSCRSEEYPGVNKRYCIRSNPKTTAKGYRGKIVDNNWLMPIYGITKKNQAVYVFNLETEDHTYRVPFVVHNCFRDDSGGGPLELVAMMNGLIECGEAGKGCLIKKEGLLKKTIELLSSKYGIDPKDIPYEISEGKANEIKISKVKRIVESIAEYMNVITMSNSEKSLIYTDGVYKEASNLMLKSFFLSLGATTNNIRAECLETLKASTVIDEKEMDNDPFTICVENGLLSINPETWEITLLPHDPNYMNMIKLPVSYVPGSDCPKIKQFIKDLFITNQCPECNRVIDGNTCPTCKTKGIETGYNSVLIVEELFGYLIFKRYFIHKAFLFIGAGRNGKSTLLNLIRNFLGNENVTSIPIHKLGDRFTPSELFGKLANVSGDISSDALKHTERFKEITGEDFLLVERKFQQPFYMVNVAKQIFTGNQAPKTGDGSYGFYSRFIILNFLKRFDFEPGADKSPNPNLLRDLTSPEELSGLLNLALERLKDLVANNKFTGALSVSETSEMFEELSNPEDVIRQFYGDCLVPQPNGYVGTVALDQRFQEWTKIYGYKPIYINVFIKLMKKIYHLRDMRKMIDGRYITVLVGVGMRK